MNSTLNNFTDKTHKSLAKKQNVFKPFTEKKDIVVDFMNGIMQKIAYKKDFSELIGESLFALSKLNKPEKYGPMISLVNKIYNFLINKNYSNDIKFNCFIETEFYKAVEKQKDIMDCLDFDIIEEYDFLDKYRLSLRKYLRVVTNVEESKKYILSSNTLLNLILKKDENMREKVYEIDFSNKNITLKTAVELLNQIVLGKDDNGNLLFKECCSIDLSYNFLLLGKNKSLTTEFVKLLSKFIACDNEKTVYLCNNTPIIHDDWLKNFQDNNLKSSIILHC